MAQNPFPLDQVQTQLIRPSSNLTAAQVAPPRATGLSAGIRAFGKALGSAAEVAKARKFEEDMITAGLYAAKEQIAPGLVSQEALTHNYKLLDENFTAKTLKQVELYSNNTASDIYNNSALTSVQKARELTDFVNKVRETGRSSITHSGKALSALNVGLDGYLQEWYLEIARHEKTQRMGTAIENVREKVADLFNGGETFTTSSIKKYVEALKKQELEHKYIIVEGKRIRATIDLDLNKAVLVIAKDQVLEQYENGNITPYIDLKERWKDYYKPLSDKEQALITGGKSDAIGDHQTYKEIIEDLDKRVSKIQKNKTAEHKLADDEWFSAKQLEYITKGKHWGGRADALEFHHRYHEDAATQITKFKKAIEATKYGISSNNFKEVLGKINSGPGFYDEEAVIKFALDHHLDATAISRVRTITSERKTEFKENVSLLDKTNIFTTGMIKSLLDNTYLQNKIGPELMKRGTKEEDYRTAPGNWLEKWLLVAQSIDWPKDVKNSIQNLRVATTTIDTRILELSQNRIFDTANINKYGGSRTFAPSEVRDHAKKFQQVIEEILHALTRYEWKNGEMVEIEGWKPYIVNP